MLASTLLCTPFALQKFIRAAKRYAQAIRRENSEKLQKKNKKAKTVFVDIKLGKFLSDMDDVRHYISYKGSFTSPVRHCKEAVTWIVYVVPVEVLEAFVSTP